MLRILFKIELYMVYIVLGFGIGTVYWDGVTILRVIVLFLTLCLMIISHKTYRSIFSIKVREVKLGEAKPDELPEELWNKMQELLQYTSDCEKENEDK